MTKDPASGNGPNMLDELKAKEALLANMTTVQNSYYAVYGPNGGGNDLKAHQIVNLAKAGLAASDSNLNIDGIPVVLGSVCEVIAQLAYELAQGIDEEEQMLRKKIDSA